MKNEARESLRRRAILAVAEAKNRPSLARHLAAETNATVEQATATLRAAGADVSRAAAEGGAAVARRLLGMRPDPARDAEIAASVASRVAQPAEPDAGAEEDFRRDFEAGRQAASRLIGKRLN